MGGGGGGGGGGGTLLGGPDYSEFLYWWPQEWLSLPPCEGGVLAGIEIPTVVSASFRFPY